MKHLAEYRDPIAIKHFLAKIKAEVTRPWTIMEICGGQTHSLVKNGILELLPPEITMVHGPGCPVCVTPTSVIDSAIELALQENVILCSFGDMIRVPGTQISLMHAKAKGADVRILYSPLEAVELACKHPDKEVVFFAVGFETTAPANGLAILQAKEQEVPNFSLLSSHVCVPPAISAIMSDLECRVQAFLAAGHVCTITGMSDYQPLVGQFHIPIVITGFEPLDLVKGIYHAVRQLEAGKYQLENHYDRMVRSGGNESAISLLQTVFERDDKEWRGLGDIPQSGLRMRDDFKQFDAFRKFKLHRKISKSDSRCIAGQILKGLKKPHQCPEFGKGCTPQKPLGAPMVSSEGACAAYFQHQPIAL